MITFTFDSKANVIITFKMKAIKEKNNFRSDCPISSALDLFGDKWSLLIIRDLVYFGERTFKDFSNDLTKFLNSNLFISKFYTRYVKFAMLICVLDILNLKGFSTPTTL